MLDHEKDIYQSFHTSFLWHSLPSLSLFDTILNLDSLKWVQLSALNRSLLIFQETFPRHHLLLFSPTHPQRDRQELSCHSERCSDVLLYVMYMTQQDAAIGWLQSIQVALSQIRQTNFWCFIVLWQFCNSTLINPYLVKTFRWHPGGKRQLLSSFTTWPVVLAVVSTLTSLKWS